MDKFKNYISKILPITVTTFFILLVFWVVFLLMNLSFESYFLASSRAFFASSFILISGFTLWIAATKALDEAKKNQIKSINDNKSTTEPEKQTKSGCLSKSLWIFKSF